MTIAKARAVLERASRLSKQDWEVLFGMFVPYGMEHLREPNRLAHLAALIEADNAEEWNDFYDGEFLPTLKRVRAPEYAEQILGFVLNGEFNEEHISAEIHAALTGWWFHALETGVATDSGQVRSSGKHYHQHERESSMSESESKPRRRIPAAEKAARDLEVAQRKLDRAKESLERHSAAAEEAQEVVEEQQDLVDFLSKHPALKQAGVERALGD